MPRFSGRSILREINYFQRYSLPYYSVPRCLPIPPFLRNILDKLARKGKKIKRRCPQTRYEIRSFSTWMQFPSILTRIIFRLVTRRANLPFIGRFSCNNGPVDYRDCPNLRSDPGGRFQNTRSKTNYCSAVLPLARWKNIRRDERASNTDYVTTVYTYIYVSKTFHETRRLPSRFLVASLNLMLPLPPTL